MAKRSQLPLTALRAFEAFARLGKMSLAADELCVTHGAVSRQVRSLEAVCGAKLTRDTSQPDQGCIADQVDDRLGVLHPRPSIGCGFR